MEERAKKIVEACMQEKCKNPIKIFNLPERKLAKGYAADLTILDINNYREYTKDEILSMGKNSPFIGMKLTGFPKYTMVNGKIIWNE